MEKAKAPDRSICFLIIIVYVPVFILQPLLDCHNGIKYFQTFRFYLKNHVLGESSTDRSPQILDFELLEVRQVSKVTMPQSHQK